MTERQHGWERLRDFFARGGKIEIPEGEDLMRDVRPQFRWFSGLIGDADGIRDMTADEIAKMNAAEETMAKVRKRLVSGVPMEMGVDLASGVSEAWLMWWDAEEGKMIYRKLDPADMVRRDEEGEGSPDDGSD